jgi:hypothetical protein
MALNEALEPVLIEADVCAQRRWRPEIELHLWR